MVAMTAPRHVSWQRHAFVLQQRSKPHVCACVQPGVASVYCSIVQQTRNGVECYCREFPQLEGLPFGEARSLDSPEKL